ncbi:unnamed protein product [Tuber aestivum]|uniref:Uncharacterized protein n=1 Tax=Tuber aestivum TaxID=59557 RepID=A0A292PV73_9PEZI|nr:unnamed protein product [Tuber aestivum]
MLTPPITPKTSSGTSSPPADLTRPQQSSTWEIEPGMISRPRPQPCRHRHGALLRVVILGFASTNIVEINSVQNLIGVRKPLDWYVAPDMGEWRLAPIGSRCGKRALTTAGFGFHSDTEREPRRRRALTRRVGDRLIGAEEDGVRRIGIPTSAGNGGSSSSLVGLIGCFSMLILMKL